MNPNPNPNAAARRDQQPQRQSNGRVSLRGCWELLIKLLILLILIAILIAYWTRVFGDFGTRGLDPWAWIVLLILIALLIWLIWRQKHFVMLNCGVTQPTGCKHGDTTILPGRVLERITGTASGLGFSRYTLELLWNGTTVVPNAIIYADGAGNPDATLTFGNHQVSGGTLGFVDIQQAVLGAGIGILTSTNFEVRLRVIGIDNSHKDCASSFQITAAAAYIKRIGGAWAHDVISANEPLRLADDAVSAEATVGGSISVRGAANPYGCGSEQISEYSLWVKHDPTFSVAQPGTGAAYDPLANGWTNITTVTYTTADQRTYNTLDGMPAPDFLTNQSVWGTRVVCSFIDFLPPICFPVPDLVEFYWPSSVAPSGPSGKYSFLLKVIDSTGNTYYDVQRAWIDNESIRGKITTLRYTGGANIPPCTDVLINDGSGGTRTLDIRGFATDPLIVTADLTQPTSDNFAGYSVAFRKQGAASEVAVLSSAVPAPNRATWTGGVGDPPEDLLATLDLSWVDAGVPPPNDANGVPVPADNRLARQTSCTYDIILRANDSTIVSEGTNHHIPGGEYTFPVKIVNDLP
ncbi:MAG TPA: hypothetical protein VFZ40_11045 [Pyrinomonadaceae bacterium]